MARRRRDTSPELFTSTELGIAAGLTPRTMMLLGDKRLLPKAEDQDPADRSARLYGIDALKRLALMGAFHSGGIELLLAARLVNALADDLEGAYGGLPSQMRHMGKPGIRLPDVQGDTANDYWRRRALVLAHEYVPGKARRGDVLIDVCDRQYVFVDAREGPPVLGGGGTLRVHGWERGGEAAIITHVVTEADLLGTPSDNARLREIEAEFNAARENALCTIRTNCSLAIRTGLDRIAAHRGEP